MDKNIVFLINIIHDERSRGQGYEWSIKSWEHYCKKYNCELFVLNDPLTDIKHMAPQWYKTYIFDLLDNSEIEYDQILYVDSDTIIHPNAPNIFELSEHKFCAVPAVGSMDWICRSLETYSKFLFEGFEFPYYKYFNSGVMVMNKKHKPLFKKIQNFYKENIDTIVHLQNNISVGKDQPVLNYFVNRDIPDDYKVLGYEWNMQDMTRFEVIGDDFLHTKYGYISHYNAGVKPNPGYWLEKTYKHLYDNIS
tara:strand:+ start:174 stop:923 length:750 start_codon:yes stop_codon:yes gene_type:complete